MGVSTDAILVFGIDLGEDAEDLFEVRNEDGDFEFDNVLLADAGLKDWNHETEPYEAYRARLQEAKKKAGVDLVIHCSYDYPMYILAVSLKAHQPATS